nr:hypothetical protein [Saprospiraceae bacterium]
MGQIRVSKRFATVLALAAIIVLSRIFPHPPNFTATIACILFGAAYLQTRWGWIVLLSAYWLGDLAINNLIYPSGMGFTWFTPGVIQLLVAYLLVFANAHWLLAKGAQPLQILKGAFSSSVVFFLVSNLAVWAGGSMYPQTAEGLLSCYVAALPFFGNELAGTVFY